MNDSINNKLIFLLKHKDSKKFDNFIKSINNNEISPSIVKYLYNYLYRYSSNKLVFLEKHNDKVIMNELEETNDYTMYKRSAIGIEEKNNEIKRVTVRIKYDYDNKKITFSKQVNYCLDSGLDVLILETDELVDSDVSKATENIEKIISNCSYSKISYLILEEPSLRYFDTTKISEGSINNYKSVLVDDRLYDSSDYLTEDVKRENVTGYTKQSIRQLINYYKGRYIDKEMDETFSNNRNL